MKLTKLSMAAIAGGGLITVVLLMVSPPLLGQSYFLVPPTIIPAGQYVRITSPPNHATFYTPVDIPLFAFAREEGNGLFTYTNVEFYASNSAGKIDLGPGFCLSSNHPPRVFPFPTYALQPMVRLGAVYCAVWMNAPTGSYAITAVARGRENALISLSRTSAPVNITILASATNQNPVDVVSIVATDPVAVAGTNTCWIWQGVTNTTPAWTNWLLRPPKGWGYVTNWGPKNALFTLRREGNALSNLTVNYQIGGTASNGVDYVELPGSVTLPAGQACALIPVVPIDNAVTNFSRTVVLSLLPDTNSSPQYQVGPPARAAVLIMDYWPRPLPWLLADRSFHFNTNGPDGAWFCVQESSNLVSWSNVATNQVVHGSVDYIDPDASGQAVRFYRTVPLTNGP